MEEKWKTIEWNPDYQVSNMGRVKSLKYGKERILKPEEDGNGYLQLFLYKKGKKKKMYIHRLVCAAFVQNNSLFNTDINHKNEVKSDNRSENLEWCDRQHNINYGTRNERAGKTLSKALTGVYNTKNSKPVMCIETCKIYPSLAEVQRKFGFAKENIFKCCVGKRNTCGGYHWKYVD